jgi:hypothetical protein
MIDHRIEGASAWKRADIRDEDFRVKLDGSCLDEIRRAVDEIRAHPLPTILRSPADFDMTNCHAAMAEARRILKHGVRFAVVDRLPVEELSKAEAEAIYWLLASIVARPVAQKLDGTMIYDMTPENRRCPARASVPIRRISKSASTSIMLTTRHRRRWSVSSACAPPSRAGSAAC